MRVSKAAFWPVSAASTAPSGCAGCATDARLTGLEIATVRHRGDPCNHLIAGPLGAGRSCVSDDDCDTLENYLCVSKSGSGSCQIPAVVSNGNSCAAPGAVCNIGYYCYDNCVQSKGIGKACAADFECGTGLDCIPDTATCEARVSSANCSIDDDCTTGACDIPANSDRGRCVSSIVLAPSESTCEDLR